MGADFSFAIEHLRAGGTWEGKCVEDAYVRDYGWEIETWGKGKNCSPVFGRHAPNHARCSEDPCPHRWPQKLPCIGEVDETAIAPETRACFDAFDMDGPYWVRVLTPAEFAEVCASGIDDEEKAARVRAFVEAVKLTPPETTRVVVWYGQ